MSRRIDDGKGGPQYGSIAGGATGGYGGTKNGMADGGTSGYLGQRKTGATRGGIKGGSTGAQRRRRPMWDEALDDVGRR